MVLSESDRHENDMKKKLNVGAITEVIDIIVTFCYRDTRSNINITIATESNTPHEKRNRIGQP